MKSIWQMRHLTRERLLKRNSIVLPKDGRTCLERGCDLPVRSLCSGKSRLTQELSITSSLGHPLAQVQRLCRGLGVRACLASETSLNKQVCFLPFGSFDNRLLH